MSPWKALSVWSSHHVIITMVVINLISEGPSVTPLHGSRCGRTVF